MTTYKIVRYHQHGEPETQQTGLTLEEAQAHCSSPLTSSTTARSTAALAYTRRHGPWFDGYLMEKS